MTIKMGGNGVSSQLWVTYALSNTDVWKAVTLCSSLKRVLTSRKVGVIVSQKVGNPLRELLHQVFDVFIALDGERNTVGVKDEDFVKLFPLTLKPYGKCVVLSPSMLVIRNCDKIFDEYNANQQQVFVWSRGGDESSSMFIVRPSPKIFKELMNSLRSINETGVETYLRNWTKNQAGIQIFLEEKYNLVLERDLLLKKEDDVPVVNTKDVAVDVNLDNYSYFAKMILKYRKLIYEESVEPLLVSMTRNVSIPEIDVDDDDDSSYATRMNGGKEPIAIVGMSCRYPSANNLEEFWNLLFKGEDGTGPPPEFRWTPQLVGLAGLQRRDQNAGFLKHPVEEFDGKFFGLSPMELEYLDPQTRLLHELVWEGLEDAAFHPQGLHGANGGVFIGSWTNDYKTILTTCGATDFYRKYMGNSIGAAAARISHLLGLTGPSIATESGCSAAMVAVHLAVKSLQVRESDFALACGVNLILHPFDKDVLPMVISNEGHCKTFDAKADGFARAEGCGVLVLKRLSKAVRDGDKIWALIRGSGMTQEGVSKSLGTPTVHCESLSMIEALKDAGVESAMVSYLEAHGTGTVVGDPMEIAAIAKAYHSKERKEPLLIGSVKTNVGHTESCSGITGIMKVVLAMQNEVIPPHINFETLNPAIDLEAVPAKIPLKPVEWRRRKNSPRFAGVSSFGITGTDGHVVIEESPHFPSNNALWSDIEKPLELIKISAKTEEAMGILLEKYKSILGTTKNELKDLAFTANISRADFQFRAVIIASSKEDAVQSIETNKLMRGELSAEPMGKVCFLFTGQGSQYPGMAKQLYETSPVFRMHFEYCKKILKNNYNIDITQVLWSEANSAEVSRTIYSQTSIFCVEYALLKLWESWGVKPDYALGHSLGEFAAAVCAGILDVEDALMLVAERSRLIDQLPRGKMLVIKADKQRVDSFMNKFAGNYKSKMLDFAAVNSPEQTVVAGDSEVVLQFSEYCKQANLKCIVLEATHAFHSKHMDPMLNAYRKVAKTVKKLGGSNCKYISGMRGSTIEAENLDTEYWVSHTREKVTFMNASKKAVELGCKIFIEIGPQPILSALTMMNNDMQLSCFPSLKKNENEWETLLNTVAKLYLNGTEIDWNGFHQFYPRSKVPLPHHPFIGKKHWPETTSIKILAIHPLLGSVIPTASAFHLFQSGLSPQSLEWLKDHAIGDKIIFPGAGYLEMCLAAGFATIEGATLSMSFPTRPMKIENLSIGAPLWLQSGSALLQTVAELSDSTSGGEWSNISLKISRRFQTPSQEFKWVPLASATFSPLPTPSETQVPFDLEHFHETLKGPSEDPLILAQMYEKLATVGLKFGPIFRSVETVWRDAEKGTLLAKVKLPPGDPLQHYIIHPVILDAMIQAIMMLRTIANLKKSLAVPIKIGKFVWLSAPSSSELYIHVKNDSALLLDSSGKMLAVMSSVELVETTVKAIESVLEALNSPLPDFWEEIWKKTPSPLEQSGNPELSERRFYTEEFHKDFHLKYNIPEEELLTTFRRLEQLVYLNYLRSLYECGWKPELNQTFGESTLFTELRVKSEFRKYFGFILTVFEREQILKQVNQEDDSNICWKLIRLPPPLEEIVSTLSTAELSSDLTEKFPPTPLLSKMGESMSSFFKGEQSPLAVLFPETSASVSKTYPSLADFYTNYINIFHSIQLTVPITLFLTELMEASSSSSNSISTTKVRILEVGSGTGSYSADFIKGLDEKGVKFEYTYTDISASFFPAAEKRFEKYLDSMKFKKLNIEEDPMTQGFVPGYFDVVLAAEVIHATRDVAESLRNINILMKPHGRLVIQETTKVNTVHCILFGPLDGYWRFQDYELRKNHCILDKERWTKVLTANGMEVDGIFSVFDNDTSFISATKLPHQIQKKEMGLKTWLVFHLPNQPISESLREKISMVEGRHVVTVTSGQSFEEDEKHEEFQVRKEAYDDFEALMEKVRNVEGREIEGIVYCWAMDQSKSQEELLLPFFNMTKTLLSLSFKVMPRLTLITDGVVPVEESGMGAYPASSLWGYAKSLKNENFYLNCRSVDITDGRMDEGRIEEIFYEIWGSDKETQVAYSGAFRFLPRLHSHKPAASTTPLQLPNGTDKYQLLLPETRSIFDLQFGPLDLPSLKEEEVEIQLKASALNFRDVLSVIKPSDDFKDSNTVGFDFAGVITKVGEKVTRWKVGDRVIGCNVHFTAMPSHLALHEELILGLPEELSFSEGATIPAVYITSVLCLMEVAKIKKEDVVLLHTASGGVGLSAFEICKHVGCVVIATAGSKRKQNYLRSLGIQHVFHSRNTQFGDQILELTHGRGVNVVLNSLTSEGFKEATLKACAKGARFVEMSVLNIWSKEEVKELRPDVQYTTIDLSKSDRGEWISLIHSMGSFLAKNVVKPIPYVRFEALHIRQALQYLQKAKHIGKVVCTMPELRREGGEVQVYTPMFNATSSYLITGGLGGIGFTVCQWMVEKGAKHVVLAGRSPPSSSIQKKINDMNTRGANVIAVQLDVGNFEECKTLLQTTMEELHLPTLRGVMHAAGTLADGLIINQNWPKLSSTFTTKINGTLHIHELTKHLNLEHFVVFSSGAALFGPPAQCNHAAANAFEDAFVHYRHSIGLPATSVNWGQWGEVGIATEMDVPGVRSISNLQGITGLEYVMSTTHRVQTAIFNIESFVTLSKLAPQLNVYLDERIWKKAYEDGGSVTLLKSAEFWERYDALTEVEEKVALVSKALQGILRMVLKLDVTDVIDEHTILQDMGVDSLMFVEIKNSVQTMFGGRLVVNASSLKDCNTVSLLANKLVQLIEGEEVEKEEPLSTEQINELILQDSVLPVHIKPQEDGQPVVPISEVKTVLLTGSTGTLGPHVLKELAKSPQITKIVCLVRAPTKEKGEERLSNVLRVKGLISQVNMEKVECITGNVAISHLGLEPNLWEELSGSIDAVFNCSAKVNHNEQYKKRESQDVRTVNIEGIKNLLEFAVEKRLKHVYQASSLLGVVKFDDSTNYVSEEWPELGDFDGLTTFAYLVSKFVNDVLVGEAVRRGIPCKAFRFPLMSGESETGYCEPENNHYLLHYLYIMKKGIMPSTPGPIVMLPVDTCAKVSLRIFFDENAPLSDIYNVGVTNLALEQEFVGVASKFGYKVDTVEFSEFIKAIQQSMAQETESVPLAMMSEVYRDENTIMKFYSGMPVIQRWLEGNPDVFMSKKVAELVPNFFESQSRTIDYVFRDLEYVKSQGWFEKFGLK